MSIARVGSLDLYYEEHGSGPPLLLLMGLAADSTAWMFQVPAFEQHYRQIAEPFHWTFTRAKLDTLLAKLTTREPHLRLAA